MAARKKPAKRATRSAKRGAKPAGRSVARASAKMGAKKGAKRPVKKVAPRAARGSKKPARGAKPPKASRAGAPAAPQPVTVPTLALVQLEPLRAEASAALARGESVELRVGVAEEGERVETLLFAPSGKAVQSSGTYVHRGDWSGVRLVTDKGHLLDPDGACFCRDCEAARGYTLDDDE